MITADNINPDKKIPKILLIEIRHLSNITGNLMISNDQYYLALKRVEFDKPLSELYKVKKNHKHLSKILLVQDILHEF